MKHFDITFGIGAIGGLGTYIADHFNGAIAGCIGILTLIHLVFKIREDIRKTKK